MSEDGHCCRRHSSYTERLHDPRGRHLTPTPSAPSGDRLKRSRRWTRFTRRSTPRYGMGQSGAYASSRGLPDGCIWEHKVAAELADRVKASVWCLRSATAPPHQETVRHGFGHARVESQVTTNSRLWSGSGRLIRPPLQPMVVPRIRGVSSGMRRYLSWRVPAGYWRIDSR